jgi:hypothetical protein
MDRSAKKKLGVGIHSPIANSHGTRPVGARPCGSEHSGANEGPSHDVSRTGVALNIRVGTLPAFRWSVILITLRTEFHTWFTSLVGDEA